MSMPKAAVGKNHGFAGFEHKIRTSRQLSHMKSESKSTGMQSFPKEKFRPCINPSNSGHHPAANLGGNDIMHW
jgi:hypothetical protein